MDEEQFREPLEAKEEAYLARIKAALADAKAGRVRRVTAQQLIDEFVLES